MNHNIKLGILITLAVLAVIFLLQNMVAVEIRFLFWSFALSRVLLILFFLALGGAVGWFGHSYYLHHKRN